MFIDPAAASLCVRVRLSIRQPKFCEASQEARRRSQLQQHRIPHAHHLNLVGLSFFLGLYTLQRLYREMCFDLLGPLSIVFYNFGVYNNVSAASNLGSDGGSNTTYYYFYYYYIYKNNYIHMV